MAEAAKVAPETKAGSLHCDPAAAPPVKDPTSTRFTLGLLTLKPNTSDKSVLALQGVLAREWLETKGYKVPPASDDPSGPPAPTVAPNLVATDFVSQKPRPGAPTLHRCFTPEVSMYIIHQEVIPVSKKGWVGLNQHALETLTICDAVVVDFQAATEPHFEALKRDLLHHQQVSGFVLHPDIDFAAPNFDAASVWRDVLGIAKHVTAARELRAATGEDAAEPLRMIKIQRFTKLRVTHCVVMQGRLKVGDRLHAPQDPKTLHSENTVVSMNEFLSTTGGAVAMTHAGPGCHVSFQTTSDSRLVQLSSSSTKSPALDAVLAYSLENCTMFATIHGLPSVEDLTGPPVFLNVKIPNEEVANLEFVCTPEQLTWTTPKEKIFVGAGLFLDGFGGRTLAYVLAKVEGATHTMVSVITDTKNNHCSPDALKRSAKQLPLGLQEKLVETFPVTVSLEGGKGYKCGGFVVATLSTYTRHRLLMQQWKELRALGVKEASAPGLSAEDSKRLLNRESVICSLLDGTHPLFHRIMGATEPKEAANKTVANCKARLKNRLLFDALQNVSYGDDLFVENPADVVAAQQEALKPSGRIMTLFNLCSRISVLLEKALSSIPMVPKIENHSELNQDYVMRVLAEIARAGKKRGDTISRWLRAQPDGSGMEEKLMKLLVEVGDGRKILSMVDINTNALKNTNLASIVGSERMPPYVYFFVATKAAICRQMPPVHLAAVGYSGVPKQSAGFSLTVQRWVGEPYHGQVALDLVKFSLYAAAMRYVLRHLFLYAPALKRMGYKIFALVWDFYHPMA